MKRAVPASVNHDGEEEPVVRGGDHSTINGRQ